MENNTYQRGEAKFKLETYEWDNLWWEQTEESNKPRVLYIGDSISGALRRYAQAGCEDRILFDRFGTSKSLDNPYFEQSIHLFGLQQERRNLIIFNNGLHGWHLSDKEEYSFYYEKTVEFLMTEFPNTPILLALTTKTGDERSQRVVVRNEVVKEIGAKYGLPIVDLYTASEMCFEFISEDGVHFTEEGYEKIAVKLLEGINELIPTY